MPNWGRGASGAASGAATGAAIGSILPGPGTLIGGIAGGLIGGLGGLFGKKKKTTNPATNLARQQYAEQSDIARGIENRSAAGSALYQTGMGQLSTFLRNQAGMDARQAAARGLAGSELETAQGVARTNAMAKGQGQLLAAGEQANRSDAANAWARALQALGILQGSAAGDLQRQDARDAGWQANVASIVGPLLQAKAGKG